MITIITNLHGEKRMDTSDLHDHHTISIMIMQIRHRIIIIITPRRGDNGDGDDNDESEQT